MVMAEFSYRKVKCPLCAALEWPRHAQRRALARACWSDVRLIEPADLGAVPIPELRFDQTLGWWHRSAEAIVRAARRIGVRTCF